MPAWPRMRRHFRKSELVSIAPQPAKTRVDSTQNFVSALAAIQFWLPIIETGRVDYLRARDSPRLDLIAPMSTVVSISFTTVGAAVLLQSGPAMAMVSSGPVCNAFGHHPKRHGGRMARP